MSTVITTVKTTIVDTRGEEFTVERKTITHCGDNPRFYSREARKEMNEVVRTITGVIADQYGEILP